MVVVLPEPAEISALAALLTADGFAPEGVAGRREVARRQGFVGGDPVGIAGVGAVGTEPAHQPLSDQPAQHVGQQEGLDIEVQQARGGRQGGVGVDGRDHQMPGQRRLHGDPRGLLVADLADHDHVRVLAQDRAEAGGERQANVTAGLHLHHPWQLELDRVLDRDDLAGAVV